MTYAEVVEERKKVHAELRNELFRRQLSNSDNFDKAILTYSSAGLALSLGFLKDLIPFSHAKCSWLLFWSWGLFVLAVVVVIVSFIFSQLGIDKQLTINEKYYLQMNDDALAERNRFAKWTDRLAYAAAASFVIAITFSTIFVSVNLKGETMTEQKRVLVTDGAPIPTIQQVSDTLTRGAPIPGVQKVPVQQPSQSQSSSATTTNSTGTVGNSGTGSTSPKP